MILKDYIYLKDKELTYYEFLLQHLATVLLYKNTLKIKHFWFLNRINEVLELYKR